MEKHEVTVTKWSKDGDGLLRAVIHVNGCPMHLEAHRVGFAEEGWCSTLQEDAGEDSDFEALNDAFAVNGQQQTVEIDGQYYVLFAFAQEK